MAGEDFDIRIAASIPGRPTMLDHVLLVAMSGGIDEGLHRLAEWIYVTYLGFHRQHAASQNLERTVAQAPPAAS